MTQMQQRSEVRSRRHCSHGMSHVPVDCDVHNALLFSEERSNKVSRTHGGVRNYLIKSNQRILLKINRRLGKTGKFPSGDTSRARFEKKKKKKKGTKACGVLHASGTRKGNSLLVTTTSREEGVPVGGISFRRRKAHHSEPHRRGGSKVLPGAEERPD